MAAILTNSTVTGVTSATALSAGTSTLTVTFTGDAFIEVQVANGSVDYITIDSITQANGKYAKTLVTGAINLRLNVIKNSGSINANIV